MSPISPVILITAGSAGLGAAAAKLFASSGYRVVINYYSNTTRATELVTELGKLSTRPAGEKNVYCIKADLSKRSDIIDLVKQTTSLMGRLDVVFSNGGWTEIRNFSDLDDNMNEDDWDRCFNMNSEGAFITTASLAGVKATGSSLAYSVSKAAQIHLVKGLATIASPNIRVNSVSPGLLLTEWGMKFSEERRDAELARTQLKKIATVEDVAEQVLCFAKSRTVTGINAIIDGGSSL